MKKTRKTRKRTGSRLLRGVAALLAVVCALGAADKHKKAVEPYGLIAGTVFRDPGFAFSGALVTIVPKPADGSDLKLRLNKAVSDARGEFAFRVPAVPMHYSVRAEAKGFKPVEKAAEINGDERVDVTFLLEPESNSQEPH